jgi:hypothetical protein
MEKLRPNVIRMNGRKSRHQLQINRENYIKMVPIPAAIMKAMGHSGEKRGRSPSPLQP